MQNVDDLKNILARLKPELISTDGDISTADGATPLAPAPDPEPTPEFQPENDYPAEDVKIFRPWRLIGSDPYDESFFAVPRARWPNPCAPMTPEAWQAYHAELMLFVQANSRLRRFCYWLRHEKLQLATLPAAKETDGLRELADRSLLIDAEQRAAEHLAWLTGLWSARGIPIPSIEELEELAASRARAVSRGAED